MEYFSGTWGIVLIVLLFGGSIFVHEFGHFLAAKAFGLKVLRFSIGFGPTLFEWKGKDGCKYMISLLPLGGYVAIPQLVSLGKLEGEEEGDAESTAGLPKAGCLAKICVSAAGALFNLILAFALAAVVYAVGVPSQEILQTTVVGSLSDITDANGLKYESPARLAGIREGDKIISIDGKKADNFENIIELVAIGSGRGSDGKPLAKIRVERDGKNIDFDVKPKLIVTNPTSGDEIRMIGVQPAMKMLAGQIMKNSPAQKAGLKEGDIVLGFNSKPIYSPAHMSAATEAYAGKTIKLDIVRGGKKMAIDIVPQRVNLTKPLLKISFDSNQISVLETGGESGVKCVRVLSAKGLKGVGASDILYQIDDAKVSSLADVEKAFAQKKKVRQLKFSDDQFNLKEVPARGAVLEAQKPQTRVMLGYALKGDETIRHIPISEQFADSLWKVYNAITSLANPKSDIGISSLAGPVDIGRLIYRLSYTGIMAVLSFTVLLNINLAVLNMLPIPVLDGGHIVFAIIEKLRGRPLPAAVFAGIQTAFSLMFLALMGYVVYIGFARWDGDNAREKQSEIYNQYYEKIKF